jgi:hypothetical protein
MFNSHLSDGRKVVSNNQSLPRPDILAVLPTPTKPLWKALVDTRGRHEKLQDFLHAPHAAC